MTEQGVAVEIELGVQRNDVALAVTVEWVDFDQRRIGLHVAGVELFAHVDELGLGVIRHVHAPGQFFALRIDQAHGGIDEDLDDLFGVVVCHFFNVHAAFAGGNEGHLLRSAVGYARQVVFLLDVGALFNIEASHFLAFGAGLVRHKLHAQNLTRACPDVVDRPGHLHATALAAAACVDLRLDHPHRSSQLLGRFNCFLHSKGRNATRHGHLELAQDFLTLVFVDFHGNGSPDRNNQDFTAHWRPRQCAVKSYETGI